MQLCDYAPFGEELGGQGGRMDARWCGFGPGIRFTGKEQEGAEGDYMHYFGARYYAGGLGRFGSPDEPFNDQNPADPQSWNLYSYVRNNPLIFTDPSGNDCVYVNSSGNGISSIDNQTTSRQCRKGGGYWVDGTVTEARFTYGSLTLKGTSNGEDTTSAHYALPTDTLPMDVAAALHEAGSSASRDLSTSTIIMGGLAAGMASTFVAPAAVEAFSAWRVAQLAGALKAAQEAWKAMPMEQRRAAMDWLSKIKPGGPPPGPLPSGASVEALKAYRDIAVRIIQSGKDVVGTQQLRVDAIDKALGGK